MMHHITMDGRHVPLKATSAKHYGYQEPTTETSFHEMLAQKTMGSLQKVNDASTHSDALTKTMLTTPDKVDVHDVVIASQKAQILLDLTKTVLQRSVTGFQTITNLR